MFKCPRCFWTGESTPDNLCPKCGMALINNPSQYEYKSKPTPMKWHKFLVYFGLFFGAFLNLMVAINILGGHYYMSQSDAVIIDAELYAAFPTLRIFDIIFAVYCIFLSGFAIYTRFQLAKFKISGPKCLYFLYTMSTLSSVIHSIAMFIIIGGAYRGSSFIINTSLSVSNIISPIIVLAIILALNFKYFNNRNDIYINR